MPRTTKASSTSSRARSRPADHLRAPKAASKFAELRVIASAYAKRYKGKVKRGDYLVAGLPRCRYEVAGTYRRRRLTFRIFDGGCVVEGETLPVAKGAISLRRTADRATIEVQMSAPWVYDRIFRDRTITNREALAATKAPRIRQAYELVRGSGHNAVLAILPKSSGEDSHEATMLFLYSDEEERPDFEGLEARLDVLATLFPSPGQRPKAVVARKEPVFSKAAYCIRIGARLKSGRDAAPHSFGGSLESPVMCRNCRSPMHLLLTIDTRAPALELRVPGRGDFRIVYCLNCMNFPGLLYIDYSKSRLRVIRQDEAHRVNEDGPIPGRTVTLAPLEPASRSGSKIGGTPNWVQGAETPDCARCRKRMAFLAQLRSSPHLGFVDDGTLYTFVCTRCRVSASLVQSH
jgi:hypothetical protein